MKYLVLCVLLLAACNQVSEPVAGRYYVGDENECKLIKFGCPEGFIPFFDENGCGCEQTDENVFEEPTHIPVNATECQDEQRNVDACVEIYQPVCGYFDSSQVHCVSDPCGITYSNSCKACNNELVKYYIDGNCPV